MAANGRSGCDWVNTMSMTEGMIFRFGLKRSKKILNYTSEYPWDFLHIQKCCFCVTDVTIARHFPINSISLSKLCVDCLYLLVFESKDSDITNLRKCAEYCFAFKEYSSGHLHLVFVFFNAKM